MKSWLFVIGTGTMVLAVTLPRGASPARRLRLAGSAARVVRVGVSAVARAPL